MTEETPARAAARARLLRPARRPGASPPPVLRPDAPSRRLRAVVAYDGSAFAGWQRQRDHVAVQELLEVAIEDATGIAVTVAAAGRTDAGVHAEGQVAAFDTRTALPASAVKHLCDHVLPPELRVLSVDDAEPGFDPQRECAGKLYRYLLRPGVPETPTWSRIAWCLREPLDLGAMRAAAAHLVGTHDFRAFRTDPGPERRGEDTVRTVTRLDVEAALGLVRVEAEGPGFLYMMVRNLTAALVEVGTGRRPPGWAADVLASRDRRLLPPPAPAAGLCMVRVTYGPVPGRACAGSPPAGFPPEPAAG